MLEDFDEMIDGYFSNRQNKKEILQDLILQYQEHCDEGLLEALLDWFEDSQS